MQRPSELPNIARIGALIGNPVRAQFIGALMDGGERSASELAALVRATPQSASAHLASLVAGGLLTVRPQGRHRFYRLRNEQVAAAIEVLSLTATETDTVQRRTFPEGIRRARRCYDHLAGRLGVMICDFAVTRRYVAASSGGVTLTKAGSRWLATLELEPPSELRRPLARLCQDWTERRPHLAGWLGAALCRRLEEQDVIRRRSDSRALIVTPPGRVVLARLFDVQPMRLEDTERQP